MLDLIYDIPERTPDRPGPPHRGISPSTDRMIGGVQTPVDAIHPSLEVGGDGGEWPDMASPSPAPFRRPGSLPLPRSWLAPPQNLGPGDIPF